MQKTEITLVVMPYPLNYALGCEQGGEERQCEIVDGTVAQPCEDAKSGKVPFCPRAHYLGNPWEEHPDFNIHISQCPG